MIVLGSNIKRGNTSSCGCLRSEVSSASLTTHGLSYKAPEYVVWLSIRQRCENPQNGSYARYGGRGITVCERWSSYENFLLDLGPRPTVKHQVDRIDNDLGYSPENCRWATPQEQANNRRSNRLITYAGRTQTLMQWVRETGLARHVIEQRIDRLGWTVEAAMTTPSGFVGSQRPNSGFAHLHPAAVGCFAMPATHERVRGRHG